VQTKFQILLHSRKSKDFQLSCKRQKAKGEEKPAKEQDREREHYR
jgi:hypothetical protein